MRAATSAPFVCDMTAAPDSPRERMAEYRRLFAHALARRERTADAVIWRFAARPGVEARVRDLAAREAACCPFLRYTVAVEADQVVFEIAGDGNPALQPVLDMVHGRPGEIAAGFPALMERLAAVGIAIRTREQGSRRA